MKTENNVLNIAVAEPESLSDSTPDPLTLRPFDPLTPSNSSSSEALLEKEVDEGALSRSDASTLVRSDAPLSASNGKRDQGRGVDSAPSTINSELSTTNSESDASTLQRSNAPTSFSAISESGDASTLPRSYAPTSFSAILATLHTPVPW